MRNPIVGSLGAPCLAALLGLTASAALAIPLPNPGTHLFESDFLGSSSEVYDDDTVRGLVEGWTGVRYGAHGGTTFPTSTVSGSIISYQGGQGDFSDDIRISHSLSGIPSDYLLQVVFRRDGSPSVDRPSFKMVMDGVSHFVDTGPSHLTGISGNTTSYALTTGTWYIMEIIDRRPGAQTEVRLDGENYDSPQSSVDWIYIDSAPVISNLYEMRIWEAGDVRPSSPLVWIVPEPTTALLLATGLAALAAAGRRRRRRS